MTDNRLVYVLKISSVIVLTVFLCYLFAVSYGDTAKVKHKKSEINYAVIGTWELEDGSDSVYVFKKDGTGEYCGSPISYEIEGNKISIFYDGDSKPFVNEFFIDGDKLGIKDSFNNFAMYTKK